jgi:hypothetical protein
VRIRVLVDYKKIIMSTRFLTVVICSIQLLGCSSNRYFQSECAGLVNSGSVDVLVWNTKKGSLYSLDEARKDAIYAVLYSGISNGNSCTSQPALLSNDDERKNFDKISKEFFSKSGKWTLFTSNAKVSNIIPSSVGDDNVKVYQISVSKGDLRKYLEEKKIIKSLTNGF